MGRAWEKLHSPQVKIPHEEHRQLHMVIYQRLDNPFVLGMLEAYWEAYEALNYTYADSITCNKFGIITRMVDRRQ
jgi:hypothetical protein